MADSNNKPGVYICKGCGIGDAVSIDELAGVATQNKAAVCRQHDMLCGEDGRQLIESDLASGEANRVVVAACSSRVMADRFAFDGTAVARANLREQVAWTQVAGDENTQMLAADNLRMGMAQLAKTLPPAPAFEGDYSKVILVLGGGVTGMHAALEGAATGYDVTLIERSDRLGGWGAKWSKRMPTLSPYRDPQDNDIQALIDKVQATGNITVMTNAEVTRTAGSPGKFAVTVAQGGSEKILDIGSIVVATGWRPYDPNKLGHLGYGASPDVVTNIQYEEMLSQGDVKRPSDGKKPEVVAFVQCAGSRDENHLPYCSSVCCGVSIKQALQTVEGSPDASAYILYQELRTPGTAEEFYRRAQEAGIIFMKGDVKGVGSDLTITYQDALLGEEIPLQGIDLVVLATGMVPNSTNPDMAAAEKGADQLNDDINPRGPLALATAPSADAVESAPAPAVKPGSAPPPPKQEKQEIVEAALPGGPLLNLQYRQGPHIPILAHGFSDSHYLCFPYETRRTGIYTCGPVRRPMDMGEAAEDSAGAVLKAIQAMENAARGESTLPRTGDLSYPKFGLDICTKCRRCTVECPFGAIDEDENDFPILNASRCRRCGTCMGACPVRTISFDNYSPQMVTEMISAIEVPDEFSGKPRLLVFACENDAMPALDMAGINRKSINTFVRFIPVRCLGSVTLLWISTALEKGFDGVMLMGCKSGDDYQCHYVKGSAMAKERLSKVGETLKSLMLEEERVQMVEISIADSTYIAKVINEFAEQIITIGLNPFKGF